VTDDGANFVWIICEVVMFKPIHSLFWYGNEAQMCMQCL